jgi:hypothetical protein
VEDRDREVKRLAARLFWLNDQYPWAVFRIAVDMDRATMVDDQRDRALEFLRIAGRHERQMLFLPIRHREFGLQELHPIAL